MNIGLRTISPIVTLSIIEKNLVINQFKEVINNIITVEITGYKNIFVNLFILSCVFNC